MFVGPAMEDNEHLRSSLETTAPGGNFGFASCLKRLRLACCTKQAALSIAIGCSDAAVSFWESGARVPNSTSLTRLLAVLAQEGIPMPDLLELRRSWITEQASRRSGARSR